MNLFNNNLKGGSPPKGHTMNNYKLSLKDINPKLGKKVKQLLIRTKKSRIDFDKEQSLLLKEGKIINKAKYYPF